MLIGGVEPPERPAKIHVSGYVFATDKGSDSFLVTVWPKIDGVPPLSPLTIRAMIRVKENFTCLSQLLPRINSLIGFSAHILSFKNGIFLWPFIAILIFHPIVTMATDLMSAKTIWNEHLFRFCVRSGYRFCDFIVVQIF
jgi:hypothetical protein